eukprot:360078-Chlamydomonas_euryale.AAC.15
MPLPQRTRCLEGFCLLRSAGCHSGSHDAAALPLLLILDALPMLLHRNATSASRQPHYAGLPTRKADFKHRCRSGFACSNAQAAAPAAVAAAAAAKAASAAAAPAACSVTLGAQAAALVACCGGSVLCVRASACRRYGAAAMALLQVRTAGIQQVRTPPGWQWW